jgi:HlyD family secretion protein
VQSGEPLFALEETSERAARDEAERRLAQAQANWEDAKKGKRPSEIASLEAQSQQASLALSLSAVELARQERLLKDRATAVQDVDRARTTHDQNRQRLAQVVADLETARLGARPDQLVAEEANVRAWQAALVQAEWNLGQKRQLAPEAGLVFDTLYREGEWVAAGRPVVALLPPRRIKVRAFLPQARLGSLHLGDGAQVWIDGASGPVVGRVSFISPQAEYTPPVIYSRESRSKLVFLVEVLFDAPVAVNLHPGQPVDVQFGP